MIESSVGGGVILKAVTAEYFSEGSMAAGDSLKDPIEMVGCIALLRIMKPYRS